jgi:hypothetical protein
MRSVGPVRVFGRVPTVPDEDVAAIRRHRLDFILNFSSSGCSVELRDTAKHGVWSFAVGGSLTGPTEPMGFWQAYRGVPATKVALVRDADRPSMTVVLWEGAFRTHEWSWVRNMDAVLMGSADWPLHVVRRIRVGGDHPVRLGPPVGRGPLPANRHLVAFVMKAIVRRAAMHVRALLFCDQFNVGIVDAPIQSFLADPTPSIRWFSSPDPRRFVADPFAIQRNGRTTILMEEWDYETRKGRIVATELGLDGEPTDPVPAMEFDVHASYPFLFEYGGHVYCIPETAGANRIDLYRAGSFPREWVRAACLVRDVPARDATIFRHHDRWWLLFVVDRPATDELHAWYADDPLGPWHPHATNPVKIDVRSSRPAGTPFVHGGRLFRPAQDGSGTYGGAVVLNKVLRLTPQEFEEEPALRIEPNGRGPYPAGLHTISAVGDLTLIDGKRSVFTWPAFRRQLRLRLDLVRSNGGSVRGQPAVLPTAHNGWNAVEATGFGRQKAHVAGEEKR